MALLWEMGGSATGVLIPDRNREQCGDGQNNTPMKRWRMSKSGHKGSKQATATPARAATRWRRSTGILRPGGAGLTSGLPRVVAGHQRNTNFDQVSGGKQNRK